jgi:hypothetical protein
MAQPHATMTAGVRQVDNDVANGVAGDGREVSAEIVVISQSGCASS